MKISEAIASMQWAIQEEYLLRLVHCDGEITALDRTGEAVSGEYAVSDGIATIPLKGVIFQENTFLSQFVAWLFGGTILSDFSAQMQAAKNDPMVRSILLDVNSPGGEAFGIEAAAREIDKVAKIKPVVAYVDGMAASAAYWLASAASSIVLSGESSQVGSIGVVLSVRDQREADKKAGVTRHEIVSSQSPMKRVDPATDEGRTHLLEYVDSMAEVFINSVAANRSVSPAFVKSEFGKGAMKLGYDAKGRNMVDKVQSLAELRTSLLAGSYQFGGPAANLTKEGQAEMLNPTQGQAAEPTPVATQVDIAAVRAETIKAERARISSILTHAEAEGREPLARALALESDMNAEAAGRIMAMAPKAAASAPVNALAAAMAAVPNPKVGADAGGAEANDEQTEIRAILALAGGK